jgi:prolyl oligopeptidase
MPVAALALAAALSAPALPPPPRTPIRAVVEAHHGVTVADPYRWLERSDDPEVQAWTQAQDRRTRAHLAAFPGMAGLKERVKELMFKPVGRYGAVARRGANWFALKSQPPRQQPFLVTLASPDDLASEKVLLDPLALDPSGGSTIDFFEPSPDGRLVAVSISEKGTESGALRLFEVAGGKELPDRLPRVNGGTAGGSVAWAAGGAGLWYTRYPATGERPAEDLAFFQEVWFHKVGTPVEQDVYELGREFDAPRIAEHFLEASEDGQRVLDLVQRGDGGEFALYVRKPEGGWRQVAGIADGVKAARHGLDGGLWLLSRAGAPRGKVLRLSADDPDLARATAVAAAAEGAIDDFAVTASRLYLAEIAGGPSTLRVLDLAGKPLGVLPTEPVTAVSALHRTGPGEVLYQSSSFTLPPAWFLAEDGATAPRRVALSARAPVDYSDVEVIRELAVSKDGTKIPITILQRQGTKRNGRNPALLTGYGGYGVSVLPYYSNTRRVLLDHGFVLAVANIRGGGEYGEEWHLGGNLTRKQNVFDDFAACAKHLADRGYTRPERLVLQGGSNGGLLMGAMITQHPGIARAVVAQVGIFDMIRVEETPNGAFNVTEFGTVKDPAQFAALHAYSPYHRVQRGTAYPAVLFTAGANDPRVDAWHAKKMTARLQAATSSRRPVLLRVSGFGHGMGTPLDERVAEAAETYAFIFEQLGVRLRPQPAPGLAQR